MQINKGKLLSILPTPRAPQTHQDHHISFRYYQCCCYCSAFCSYVHPETQRVQLNFGPIRGVSYFSGTVQLRYDVVCYCLVVLSLVQEPIGLVQHSAFWLLQVFHLLSKWEHHCPFFCFLWSCNTNVKICSFQFQFHARQ